MKIALVILNADPGRGGAERYTVDLAAALTERGHQIVLLSGNRKSLQTVEQRTDQGYMSVTFPMQGFTRSQKYLSFDREVRAWLNRNPQDLVHAMLPIQACDIYHPHAGLAVDALRGKPVQTLLNPRRRLFATVERRLLTGKNPPVVTCLSDLVKGEFLRAYPDYPTSHLERLFNAVNLERFTPATNPPATQPMEALLVAQSFKLKGLATAIRALAQVPDVTLTVVGGDNPVPYRKLARQLNVEQRVTFAGEQRDVRPSYHRSAFLVLPTHRDSCSLVVLEALACGLPVISTRFNGACEIMRNEEHGFILDDPSDADALADAMRRLADPACNSAARRACVALRPRLSFDEHLTTLMNIYTRTLENRRASC